MYQAQLDHIGADGNVAGLPVTETFTLYEDAGCTIPKNLTGFSARFALRHLNERGKILVDATTLNGGIALGGAAGTVVLQTGEITPDHAAIPAGIHPYSIEVFDASANLVYSVFGRREFRVRL